MLGISKLASSVLPSATLAAGAKARQLRSQGVKVFDFSLGEPDFPTPEHICQAAITAMKSGQTRYTPAQGTAELRGAIARWYKKFYNLDCNAEQIVVSNGAKHSIHNALVALVGPGDEVIIPTPYWVSYSDLVSMTGAKPVLVPGSMANGFRVTPDQIKKAITPRTRLLLLNSPSNPTGAVYSRDELLAFADLVLEAKIAVLSDEIYERLIYNGTPPACFATLRPGLMDQTVTISGVSKTYAMTGWRIGWTISPEAVAKAMGNIQSQETSNPCSISQAAAIAALEGEQECVGSMRLEFQARRDLVCTRLKSMKGIQCPLPDGAFYAFFDVSSYFGKSFQGKKVTDSASFCLACLEQAHVNLVQGSAFGAEGFARLSYATSREILQSGMVQFEKWLQSAV
ncbi:MAG: pyridoxal phosphate-dependent aminotransferase [Gemmataceae bacterium]|nr:pyridoxal phosphate-dependent aminotransferase [Gemmataceae bacterium]